MSLPTDNTGLAPSTESSSVAPSPGNIPRTIPLYRSILNRIFKEVGDLLIFTASLFFDERRRPYSKTDEEGRGRGYRALLHGSNLVLRLGTSAVAYSVALLLGHGLLTSRHPNPASSLFVFLAGLSGGAATEILESIVFDVIKPRVAGVQKVVDVFWSLRFFAPPFSFAWYSAVIGTLRGAVFGVLASLIGLGLPQRKGHYDLASTLFRHLISSSILGCIVLHIFFIVVFLVSFYISFLLDPNTHRRS